MKRIVSVVLSIVLAVGLMMPAHAMNNPKYVSAEIVSIKFMGDSAGFTSNFCLSGKLNNTTKYTAKIIGVTVDANCVNGSETYAKMLVATPALPGIAFQGIGGMATQVTSVIPEKVASRKKVDFLTCDKQEMIKTTTENLLPSEYEKTKLMVDYTLLAKTKKAVKLLKKANKKAKSVKKLKKGLTVTVLAPKAVKGFIRVKAAGKSGFVAASVLKAA